MLLKKGRPLPVQHHAVGLNGMVDGDAVDVPFCFQLYGSAKKVQPCQSRFSALVDNGAAALRKGQGSLQNGFQRIL